MHNFHPPFTISAVPLCAGIVSILAIVYIGLIATVISYATLTVEFSQSVKNDEAAVGVLESQYLAGVARITGMNYLAEGYAPPVRKTFVPVKSVTALR